MPIETPDDSAKHIRLLLDENISPNIVTALWIDQIDSIALRDRALTRIADHRVFRLGAIDGRAVVTINEADFQRLAKRHDTHPGVISIPSGGSREEQAEYIRAVARFARRHPIAMQALKDKVLAVGENLTITSRVWCGLSSGADTIYLHRRYRN